MGQPHWETLGSILKILSISQSVGPGIPFLGIFPREINTNKKLHMNIQKHLILAAKTWRMFQ